MEEGVRPEMRNAGLGEAESDEDLLILFVIGFGVFGGVGIWDWDRIDKTRHEL